MAGRLDFPPHLLDLAFGIEEERGALDSHVRLAVHRLLDPDPARLRQGVVGIRQQGERQPELVGELAVTLRGIRRYSDHARAFEGRQRIAKLAGLLRASGRIVLRIEVDHRPRAEQIGLRYASPVLVEEREIRKGLSDFQHSVAYAGAASDVGMG